MHSHSVPICNRSISKISRSKTNQSFKKLHAPLSARNKHHQIGKKADKQENIKGFGNASCVSEEVRESCRVVKIADLTQPRNSILRASEQGGKDSHPNKTVHRSSNKQRRERERRGVGV